MAITSFSVERYRSFAARTSVTLKPLTLLFGYNSAGKSALARALPLVAASCGGAAFGPLALDAGVARGATYRDFVCRFEPGDRLSFRVAWDDGPEDVREVEWSLRGDEVRGHVLDTFATRSSAGAETLRLRDDLETLGQYEIFAADSKYSIRLPFDGLRPIPLGNELAAETHRDTLAKAAQRIGSLKTDVHWLGAVRAMPPRSFRQPSEPKTLGDDGRWTAQKLVTDHHGPSLVFPFVAEHIYRMFEQTMQVAPAGDEFALVVSPDPAAPVHVSIVDVGEGVSQVLAVLTLLGMLKAGQLGATPVVVLEQPEMHLHPRAERVLAEALSTTAKAPGARLLVETHSENLLLFVQLQIAKGFLSPDEVSVLWIDTDAGHSCIKSIGLDAAGRSVGWPSGVFSEDVELARELFLARRGR
ncbi:AAA family ATPase [Sorangium sp. So ce124]|uniref:AAA family ATPase n=1 Tax=Sorangium sp. So ce124 TaxID=3133280 RepID=UPI003F6184C2